MRKQYGKMYRERIGYEKKQYLRNLLIFDGMVEKTSPFGAECPVPYLWGKMQQSAPTAPCAGKGFFTCGGWVADAQRNHKVTDTV